MSALEVSDVGSHRTAQIENAADALRTSAQLRAVFEAVYRGKKQPKSLEDLKVATGIHGETRLLNLIQRLAGAHLIDRRREKNKTVCYKIQVVTMAKKKILAMAKDSQKLDKYKIKNRPWASQNTKPIIFRINQRLVKASQISIDDIGSFSRVKKIKVIDSTLNMRERDFNNGMRKIIGDQWEQHDWGGETDDLYTTRLVMKSKRISAAFAFKGRATRGVLVPGKMGKNGDQIQRLFHSPASLFVVQYQGQIAETVTEQMKTFAEIKSISSDDRIYYMIIDGQDSQRLVTAYPKEFKR